MNLVLHLPPETEALLKAAAEAAGKTPEEWALIALEDRLAAGFGQAPAERRRSQDSVSAEEWIANIRKWAESHRRLEYEADDSRESIYFGREEMILVETGQECHFGEWRDQPRFTGFPREAVIDAM